MNRNKLLAYALGPVGSASAGLLTLPLMSWHFAGGDIGRIVLLQTAASLALIVLGLGLDQAYVREFHHCGGRQAALFKNLAWPPLLLGVAAATAVWLSAPEMPSEKIFGLADGTLSLLCLLFAAGLLPVRYLSLILRMQERALAFSFSQLLPKLLVLAAVAGGSCFGPRGAGRRPDGLRPVGGHPQPPLPQGGRDLRRQRPRRCRLPKRLYGRKDGATPRKCSGWIPDSHKPV